MKNKVLRVGSGIAIVLASAFLSGQSTQAQTITTIAGSGTMGYSGDGGAATAAMVNATFGIVTDASGNVYFSDAGNDVVRKISPSGIITTIAGTGTHAYGGDGGPASAAQLAFPSGLAFDAAGNLYISDPNNYRVRKIDPSGTISTFAGTGTTGYSGDGGPATAAQIGYSDGIFVDPMGNVVIPDPPNNRIRKVNTSGVISTIVGTGTAGNTGDGGAATAAQIDNPLDVKVDLAGNLYFTDFNNHVVRKVNAAGVISTIAGTGTMGYSGDGGAATAAQLHSPAGIDLDDCGNVYISDLYNNRVRMINTSGIISTIAGNGSGSFSGDGGAATAASLYRPHGVYHDRNGDVYIADRNNFRIRKVSGFPLGHLPHFTAGASTSVTICAGSAGIAIDSLLSIVDTDAGQTETWSVNMLPANGSLSGFSAVATSTGGTVSPSGLFYVPTSGFSGLDTFKIAVSDCRTTALISIYVTVAPLPDAGIISGRDSMCAGDTATFHPGSSGGSWLSTNTTIASVSATGIVTAVATGTVNIKYIVSNICGADTAVFPVRVRTHASCTAEIGNIGPVGGLLVYPNPSHGAFTISLPANSGSEASVIITDMFGVQVSEFIVMPATINPVMLNVPPGLYFVSVVTNGERQNKKIVVE